MAPPDLSNHRYVMLVRGLEPQLPPLADVVVFCRRNLAEELERIRLWTGLQPHSFHLETRNVIVPDDPALDTPAYYLRQLPAGVARVSIYATEPRIPLEPLPDPNQLGFVVAYSAKDDTGWRPEGDTWIQASIGLRGARSGTFERRVSDLVLDLILEMSIANSECMMDVLRPAIEALTREGLYRRKVEFALADYGTALSGTRVCRTPYGDLLPDSRYVSFTSLGRAEARRDPFGEAIRMWDRFVTTSLSSFLPTREAAIRNLRSRRLIGGQLSAKAIAEELTKHPSPGSYVLIRPREVPRLSRDVRQVMALFQRRRWTSRAVAIFPPDKLPPNFRRLVTDNFITPVRFFVAAG